MPRILAMAGSARKASFNKKLVAEATERARDAGAEVTLVDLRDYPMPLYDGDLEAESGIPEQAKALRSLMLEHHGLAPSLMVGTSIGGLMAMFRARRKRYDFAPLVAAARALSWGEVFRVFQTENRYGIPATLRLQLRHVLGPMFRDDEGTPLNLSDLGIPLYIIATGITVDALKHDLDYYENLLDDDVQRLGVRAGVRTGFKAMNILREFLSSREALEEVVLGLVACVA